MNCQSDLSATADQVGRDDAPHAIRNGHNLQAIGEAPSMTVKRRHALLLDGP